MASRKSTKISKKQHTPDYYPVQRTINLGVPGSTLTGTTIADTGKLLSIVNRRLYRQGKLYEVKVDLDMIHTMDSDIEIKVYALSNNWDIQRAWALAKKTYEDAMAHEREVLGNRVARWEDFRVANGVAGAVQLEPQRYTAGSLAISCLDQGEHVNSSVDINGTPTVFTWGTPGAGEIGINLEWTKAGKAAQTPTNTTTDAPYAGVNSDDLNTNEITTLQTSGNNPPYPDTAQVAIWTQVGSLYYRPEAPGHPGMQRLSTGYFHAPCGLVVLQSTGFAPPSGSVRLTAKSGAYKGVAALAMSQETSE